jgi:hypothetical protein
MTDFITPPPDLLQQWIDECSDVKEPFLVHIANQAAKWGYLQHEKSLLDAMHSIVPPIDFEPDDDDD